MATPSPPSTPTPALAEQVRALRTFNRFYTQTIGVLEPYLDSDFSLTEVRVLYELAHRAGISATELGRELGLDPGYLSRILRRFENQGWLLRVPAPDDARRALLRLTDAGHAVFAPLQQRSREHAATLLLQLTEPQRAQLIGAMQTVQGLLGQAPDTAAAPAAHRLRPLQSGDLGWVVQAHGDIYAQEYGWDWTFEALVADIAAQFVRNFQPDLERGWIAERDGPAGPERVGSVFVARHSEGVAQLRLLILTPAARGLGLGARLTDEAMAFARERGYRKMVLWTNSCLEAARDLYRRRGFALVHSEPYRGYGHDLVGETWERAL